MIIEPWAIKESALDYLCDEYAMRSLMWQKFGLEEIYLGLAVIAPPPEGENPERDNYRQVILKDRLRARLQEINPSVPLSAIDDAVGQVMTPNLPTTIQNNRQFHRWLRDGVSTFTTWNRRSRIKRLCRFITKAAWPSWN